MGIVRDFTEEKIEQIANLVVEDMEASSGIIGTIKDFFDDIVHFDWDIKDHLDDVEGYQKYMINNNDVDIDMLNRILDRVKAQDECYKQIFEQKNLKQGDFIDAIKRLATMVSPVAIAQSFEEYEKRLNFIETDLNKKNKNRDATVKQVKDSYKKIREEAEYEDGFSWGKFKDQAIGAGKSIVKAAIVGALIAAAPETGGASLMFVPAVSDCVDGLTDLIFGSPSEMEAKYRNEAESDFDIGIMGLCLTKAALKYGSKYLTNAAGDAVNAEKVTLNEDATVSKNSKIGSGGTPPNEYNISKKQFGKKWGKHKWDYPDMKDLHEYEDMIEDMFKNPEKIVYDIEKNEYYYIRGDDLLRVKENGDFVSMYKGANSDRVTKAIEEGGIVWQK